MILTMLSFIVVVGVIIFVHEFGHFLAAKMMGIRVEVFSLGFPPKMFGKKVGETDYRICWIPLGGYVKMSGMIDESLDGEDSIQGHPWEFESKQAWQKIFVISAGVLMNFILAMVIFSALTAVSGVPEPVDSSVIGAVSEGNPADQAGMQPGDRILELNGEPVSTWSGITAIIHNLPEETTLDVTWERDGERFSNSMEPMREKALVEGEVRKVAMIGISQETVTRPASVMEVITGGPIITWRYIELATLTVRMLVTGKASVSDIAGPVFIAQMSGRTARSGALDFIGFIAFISVNIGFLNILPIPVLDGGHLVYILTEALIRRRIPTKIKLRVQQVGMVLLLMLMVVVFYNDIMRIFTQ